VAIQPCFDASGPQHLPGGEQEHPERLRVQLGQPAHRHHRGLQIISLIGQRDQILGDGYIRSPPRSGATIVCTSLDNYHAVSITLNRVCMFRYFSTLNTYLAVLITTQRVKSIRPTAHRRRPDGGGLARIDQP
jgi:hypothetical protein